MSTLPGTSIIKSPDNGHFFSWGSLMREKGYDTQFLYADYGYFEDMIVYYHGANDIFKNRLNMRRLLPPPETNVYRVFPPDLWYCESETNRPHPKRSRESFKRPLSRLEDA